MSISSPMLKSVSTLLLVLLSACNRNPETATGRAPNARVEAAAFNGQSYRTQDGRSAVTLISAEELEYRVPDGTTFLCRYSDQRNALRVIVTALGTQQVLYFRRVPDGLISNDGMVYLNPSALAELQRREELERHRQEAARAEQEREQLQEQQRAAIRLQESHVGRAVLFESKEAAVLNLFPSEIFFVTNTTVSDVAITFTGSERIPDARNTDKHKTDPFELSFWFGESGEPTIANDYRFGKQPGAVFHMEITTVPGHENEHETMRLYFEDSARLEQFGETVTKARLGWRTKYGDLATGRWR